MPHIVQMCGGVVVIISVVEGCKTLHAAHNTAQNVQIILFMAYWEEVGAVRGEGGPRLVIHFLCKFVIGACCLCNIAAFFWKEVVMLHKSTNGDLNYCSYGQLVVYTIQQSGYMCIRG